MNTVARKRETLLVVLFAAEHEVSGCLGHVVGGVDDLPDLESHVRVADQSI